MEMLTIFIRQRIVSHAVFVYDKPRINRHASVDICAVSLEF